MSRVVNYKKQLEDTRKKIKNNLDYFDSLGDFYITKTLKENLNDILIEIDRVKKLVDDYEKKGYVDLQPGSRL